MTVVILLILGKYFQENKRICRITIIDAESENKLLTLQYQFVCPLIISLQFLNIYLWVNKWRFKALLVVDLYEQ